MKNFSLRKYRRLPRFQQVLVGVFIVVVAFVIWLITRLTPSTAAVSLKITVDCDNVGEIWCDYSLGGRDLGTMYVGVEDNNVRVPFERGEDVSMNIPAEAFNNKTQLRAEKFGFELSVLDTNGERHTVHCEDAEFFAELGRKYWFTLTCADGEYFCA